jgi:ribosomal protein L16 Arg81 hydroxylase
MRQQQKFDLATLLRPVPPAKFFDEHWQEKPLLVSRNDRDYFGTLLSLEEIDPLITVLPSDLVTLANSDDPLDVAEFARPDGTLDVVKACQFFATGTTLIVQEAHKRHEKLAALCRTLECELGATVQCNIYVTPPGGKGFDTHYDTHDVLLMQITGAKEWTIFNSPIRLPLAGQPYDPNLHPAGAATMSFMLQAGDFLYIPRGFLHHARSADEISVHVTVGVLPYRWSDVMLEAIAQLCLSDPAFRRALPVDLGKRDFDLAAARRIFADLLARVSAQASPDGVLDRLANEFVVSRSALVPGQLAQALQSPHLSSADEVGARPASIYRIQTQGDQISIKSHGREITLPVEAHAALTFALENERYCVRDLPGDFDDETKIILVKRLIDEGLVWKLPGR